VARPHGRGAVLRGLFQLDPRAQIPKYLQVVEGVIAGLREGALKKGTRLPSINEACRASRLSRDTVVKAYDRLQARGYLSAVHGKGFFLRTDAPDPPIRVLVVFDRLNAYREQEYAGLAETLGGRADLDVCFHHFDADFFVRLLAGARGKYDRYLVEPFPSPEVRRAVAALEEAGAEVLVVDVHAGVPGRNTSFIVQDFGDQLVGALRSGLSRLRRYQRLTLVFAPEHHHPAQIVESVARFGREAGLPTRAVPRLTEDMVQPGAAFLTIDDEDLLALVKRCGAAGLRLGEEVGLVSYNDTPLKEIVGGGVSVVSIDFHALGVRAAQHLLQPGPVRETVPTHLVLRGSL
jgi:DNA-binding transcriptional regulator YhcF (GntR family)